jgi:hypothetical protein
VIFNESSNPAFPLIGITSPFKVAIAERGLVASIKDIPVILSEDAG